MCYSQSRLFHFFLTPHDEASDLHIIIHVIAFPGYIMVNMKLDEHSWDMVRNTPGVAGFVSSGVKPVPLAIEEVDAILQRMEEAPSEVKMTFKEGQSVRVTGGPFVDFIGKVDQINLDKGKATVLLSLFGRETPVELDLLAIERI